MLLEKVMWEEHRLHYIVRQDNSVYVFLFNTHFIFVWFSYNYQKRIVLYIQGQRDTDTELMQTHSFVNGLFVQTIRSPD